MKIMNYDNRIKVKKRKNQEYTMKKDKNKIQYKELNDF